jgi:hypothetical protein
MANDINPTWFKLIEPYYQVSPSTYLASVSTDTTGLGTKDSEE